jgi:prolyl-tRNA synthetase
VAPFDVHLIVLGGDAAIREQAEALYAALNRLAVEVLYDDRNESAGVKFADADLLGMPLRATLSSRSLKAGGVELKRRIDGPEDAWTAPVENAASTIQAEVRALRATYRAAADALDPGT